MCCQGQRNLPCSKPHVIVYQLTLTVQVSCTIYSTVEGISLGYIVQALNFGLFVFLKD